MNDMTSLRSDLFIPTSKNQLPTTSQPPEKFQADYFIGKWAALLELDAPDLASFQDDVLKPPRIMMFQAMATRDDALIAPSPDYTCRTLVLDLPQSFFEELLDPSLRQSDKLVAALKQIIEKARAHFKPQRAVVTIYDNSKFSGLVSYCAVTMDVGIMWLNPLGTTKLDEIKCPEQRCNALRTRVRISMTYQKVGNVPVTQLSPAKGIDVSKLPKKK